MTIITCQHCYAEIDVAKDPRCVVYDPSGATDVSCQKCRDIRLYRLEVEKVNRSTDRNINGTKRGVAGMRNNE